MPYDRPTLTDLRGQAAADISAELPSTQGLLRFSNLRIAGDVLAQMTSGHYGYLDWIARQSVPFTCTDEFLDSWAALRGVSRKPASRASGVVRFAAAAGRTIPAGTAIARGDGATYTADEDASTVAGAIDVAVTADDPGAGGNSDVGTPMNLSVAIEGVSGSGSVQSDIGGGGPIEGNDALRSRMLSAYANPPRGGSRSDYLEWALAVPGVTRAWITAGGMGPGTVTVYFMMDDVRADEGGFPQGTDGVASGDDRDGHATGDQRKVANAVFDLQPVTALVYAVAPDPNTIDITIAGLSSTSTATRNAVKAAIAAALLIDAAPGGTTALSTIDAAITGVPGTGGFLITNIAASDGSVTPSPVGNITSGAGALAVLGTVTFA
jgi:uncharacterized phage protein gp47/JayE